MNSSPFKSDILKFQKIPGIQKITEIFSDVKPMLATLIEEPFEEDGWMYEIKWDGYRALAYLNNGAVDLRSRNNKSFNEKFYPIYESLKKLSCNAIFDGEIIAINDSGLPDFGRLQTWRSEADGELLFYVFDIIWYEGYSLINTPLEERRKLLESIIAEEKGKIRLSKAFNMKGKDFFSNVDKMGLEGVIAKKLSSTYTPDARSREWLKIKTKKYQEAIIGGYTKNENTTKKFSALLLGRFEGNQLVFTGSVGTGFTTKMQEQILQKLNKIEIGACPFNKIPEYNKPSRFRPNPPKAEVTWVKPDLVAEISYRTISSDGVFRHPSFKGLREDKNPREVVKEIPLNVNEVINQDVAKFHKKVVGEKSKTQRKTLLNPSDETQVRSIQGHDIKFTNLSKVFWPGEGYSKRDVLNYYYQVAPYILPYLKDRPQTLNRFPNGIEGKSFYQKDVTGKIPNWLQTYEYYSENDQRKKNFLVCSDEASLLYIASLACIEINPWSSRIQNPDYPDWCIIDLDPDNNPFDQVITAALETKNLLDQIDVNCYCKTSGSTGLHIYIPFKAKYTYEESKEFARSLVKIIHRRIPKFTSIERLTTLRKGKIYLDFLQNRPQATVASVYSLRPKPGATVSMPIHWDELKKGLKIANFTIANAIQRIQSNGDIFKGVLGKGINLQKAIKKISSINE